MAAFILIPYLHAAEEPLAHFYSLLRRLSLHMWLLLTPHRPWWRHQRTVPWSSALFLYGKAFPLKNEGFWVDCPTFISAALPMESLGSLHFFSCPSSSSPSPTDSSGSLSLAFVTSSANGATHTFICPGLITWVSWHPS